MDFSEVSKANPVKYTSTFLDEKGDLIRLPYSIIYKY